MASDLGPAGYSYVLPDDSDENIDLLEAHSSNPQDVRVQSRKKLFSHCIAFLMGGLVLSIYLIVSGSLQNTSPKAHNTSLHQNSTTNTIQTPSKTDESLLHRTHIHLRNWHNWLNDITAPDINVTIEPDSSVTETVNQIEPNSTQSFSALNPTSNPSLDALQNQQDSTTFEPTSNPSLELVNKQQSTTLNPTSNP
eukprot:78351_1